jgi:hypothetical protein
MELSSFRHSAPSTTGALPVFATFRIPRSWLSMRTRMSTSWCRVISNAFRSCAFGLLTCTVLNQPTADADLFNQSTPVAAVGFVGPHRQHRARMAGVETNYRKAHDSPHFY